MKIEYAGLSDIFFTISNLFPVRQTAKGKTVFAMENPRHTDAFVLFTGCTSICYQPGEKPFFIPQGALVYMPKNSKYMWEDTPAGSDGKTEKLLFEFTLNYADTVRGYNSKRDFCVNATGGESICFGDKVEIVSVSHKALYQKLFSLLIDAFNQQNTSTLAVYIAAYEIFKTVASDLSRNSLSTDIGIISKAISYVEDTLFPVKSIRELADMCGISIGYFERLFKEYSGMTAKDYISAKKMFFIKDQLRDKRITLEEIAEKAGYCDSGYLCRIFKKKTGMTPKEYRNLYFSQNFRNVKEGASIDHMQPI